MKKAFTLIELLVVIAIIAILAAILFPVFAQAKSAAKQTANISNVKNLATAMMIYGSDNDDVFPLVQRSEPTVTAIFGLAPWQITIQPYTKNWGIFVHPLGPTPSGDAALIAWRQTQHYGAFATAQASISQPFFQNTTALGSFSRRVCGSQPCRYDGIMGRGCDPTLGCGFYGAGAGANANRSVPSLSMTAINNPADQLMIGEAGMWDMWSLMGIDSILTYGVTWSPAQYNANGSSTTMTGPLGRRNPLPQSPDGACTPSNLCDGFQNFGIINGQATFAATDGHAVAMPYRGRMMQNMVLPDGTRVLRSMWPQGGF